MTGMTTYMVGGLGGVNIVISPLTSINPIYANVLYYQQFTAQGGTGPYTWANTTALPQGLTLYSNGNLIGNIRTATSYSFTVQATDSATPTHHVGTRSYSGTITYLSYSVSYTVIGGGGGGGGSQVDSPPNGWRAAMGGGGGAGGVICGTLSFSYSGNRTNVYTIVVGAGGSGGGTGYDCSPSITDGSKGASSAIQSIVSGFSNVSVCGGGGGGLALSNSISLPGQFLMYNGMSGGSGGGGGGGFNPSSSPYPGSVAGSGGSGNNGNSGACGLSSSLAYAGPISPAPATYQRYSGYSGGGGGAGSGGSGYNGGAGKQFSQYAPYGTAPGYPSYPGSGWFAGGGGGYKSAVDYYPTLNCATAGLGGAGGGAAGGAMVAYSGSCNTGGGGGGSATAGACGYSYGGTGYGAFGGSGGSGIVFLTVPTQYYPGTAPGASVVKICGPNTILAYRSSGSYNT